MWENGNGYIIILLLMRGKGLIKLFTSGRVPFLQHNVFTDE